jgi:hypothetical protein
MPYGGRGCNPTGVDGFRIYGQVRGHIPMWPRVMTYGAQPSAALYEKEDENKED